MSEKEYKEKSENLFKRNAVLISENDSLKAENLRLKNTIISMAKTIREKYVIQLQKEKAEMAEDFAKQIERLEEDKGQIIFESDLKINALEEMIEKMKFERSKFIDEIIDTSKGYGLVCDSCLFSLINDYDSKRISYDELLNKLQIDVIRELKLAIDDLRNGELAE